MACQNSRLWYRQVTKAKRNGADYRPDSTRRTPDDPEYASPEQIRGETITTATDVYALGVLLYELLSGRRPFQAENLNPATLERLICEGAPERPSRVRKADRAGLYERIGGELDNIVLKAMHKDPARRYSSAAEFSEDVRRYLEGFPVVARADSWG